MPHLALTDSPQKAEQLADAFRIFNELSLNLSVSYRSLEKQVAKLHEELAAVRSERLKTLVEKEKIAVRLQQILVALPAALILLDADGRVLDYNETAEVYLGQPLSGLRWAEVAERSLLPLEDIPHERQLSDGRRLNIRYSEPDPDFGRVVLLSDVSEIRALQEQASRQKHTLAMGEMVAGMAHQIRTPLSAALLYASQTVRPELDQEKRLGFSRKILERLHFLERQVSDMLMFAKDGRLTMTSFTVAELLGNLHDAMQDRVASGTVEFDIVNRAEFAHITGNEPALRGALLNLINNAVEAGSERCAIELHLANIDSERLTIIVKDNGSGMENSVLAHIFEPFFTTKASGTGLGLAVVDSVIRAHGGRIDCESVRGCGTVFTLMLPLAAETSGVLPGGFVGSRNRSKGGRL